MQVTNRFHYTVLVLKRTDSGLKKMLNDVSKSQKLIFPKEFTHDLGKQKTIFFIEFFLKIRPDIILNTVVDQK